MHKIRLKILAVLLAALLVTTAVGCSAAQSSGTVTDSVAPSVTTEDYTGDGLDADWSESEAKAVISLQDTSIEITGTGAEADGSVLTITEGGLYILSGVLSDGQVLVNAPAADTVRLVLNGVDITSNTSAAIYEAQSDEIIITLAEGTQNTVTDAASYTYADEAAEEPDAAIFAKDDLTINGTGQLTVNANFNNGIGTKDDLVIAGGSFAVTAANHGIRGRDSLTVLDGAFVIDAGNDGMQSNNDEDTAKGWVDLSGGTFDIAAAGDGIQAETMLTISGGDFAIDSAADAIHSNGNIAISGGQFALASGDDAVHADSDLTISGGTIDITACYEGLEASTMTISDGVIDIISTDDGINIAGGNDGDAGMFGRDDFAANADQWLLISGGTITITAGSDAIDINGNGEMTGGTVNLTAATLGEGQTLDVDGSWSQSGGDLTESGGSGMGGGPGGGGPGGRGNRGDMSFPADGSVREAP